MAGVKGKSGRPKGRRNQATILVRDAILRAFDKVGGEDYLAIVARDDPRTFCTLLGRVLPIQLAADGDNPLKIEIIERVIVEPTLIQGNVIDQASHSDG